MKRVTYTTLDSVKEFHVKNSQLINDRPDQSVPDACVVLRMRLIQEESSELIVGIHKDDLYDVADGLADLKYVLVGSAVSYGIALPDNFPDEDELGPLAIIADEDKPPVVVCLMKRVGALGQLLYSGSTKCEEHGWLHREQLLDAMEELDALISDIAAEYGIPLREIFFDVHRSNMTKLLSGKAAEGEKYASGDNPKGEGYSAPNTAEILSARMADLQKIKGHTVH